MDGDLSFGKVVMYGQDASSRHILDRDLALYRQLLAQALQSQNVTLVEALIPSWVFECCSPFIHLFCRIKPFRAGSRRVTHLAPDRSPSIGTLHPSASSDYKT
jgi:hypothetical protein